MAALVIAEHENGVLVNATLNAVAAASQMASSVDLLVVGHNCEAVATQASHVDGVSKVLVADAETYAFAQPENLANLVASLGKNYSHIVAAATWTSKSFLPRVAALLDVAQISEIVAVVSADTFIRPIYAGNVMITIQSQDAIKVVTVRTTGFDAVGLNGNAPVEQLPTLATKEYSRFVGAEIIQSSRPDLASARVVVSGGRGLQSGENFRLLEALADKLGAAIGASRAAVDAGFVPNDYQVGQTGKIVAPELYIAVGISGAIQHLAGMKDSKVIVAINKDPEAPIFQVADYGLVADLFHVVPELTAELE